MSDSKIVLAGLDNAGKSSLLIALDRKFGIVEDLQQLKPTIRIKRDQFTFLSQTIFRWDFGGQEKYREEYVSNRDRYFTDISMLIFVVDIQDRDRYSDALEYFRDIIDYFRDNKIAIPVSVFLHKYDPKLHESTEIEKGIFSLKDLFNQVKKNYPVDYYETSVNDIHSLIRAFSRSFTRLFRKTELISAYFVEMAETIDAYAILLFDESGLTIGEFYRPHLDLPTRNRILELYVESLEVLEQKQDTNQKIFDEKIDFIPVSGVIQKISLRNKDFTIMVLVGQEAHSTEGMAGIFQKLLPNLKEIIKDILES